MDARLAALGLVSLITIFCGTIVILSSSTDFRKKVPFMFTMGGLLLWLICLYLSNVPQERYEYALLINRLVYIAPLIALTSFNEVITYIGNVSRGHIKRPYSYIQSASFSLWTAFITSLVAMSPFAVQSISERYYESGVFSGYDVDPGPLYPLLGLGYALLVFIVIYNFLQAMRSGKKDQTHILRLILVSLILSLGLAISTNLILPIIIGGNTVLNLLGAFSPLFIIFTLTYAMLRHNLFDVRSVVGRAAIYGLTAFVLGVIYVAPVVYIMGNFILGFPFIWEKFILAVIAGTFAATNYTRIRNLFDSLTARYFFRDAYDPAIVLSQLNRLLVTTADLEGMINRTASMIITTIKAEFCVFVFEGEAHDKLRVVGDNYHKQFTFDSYSNIQEIMPAEQKILITENASVGKEELKKNDIAAIIRLADETNKLDIGYIILGYKKSGNSFTGQDMQTLVSMADVLVIAIQNALRFEEIQQFNLTLQKRVNEATRQLRRTNSKLEALDETKDDFISMASHQLRSPLTSVKGYISMVLDGDAGKLTPMQRKMLDQAFLSSQRMVFLIADLLNVSRLKTGKFVIEPSKVNLAKVVSDEVEQLKETAKNRSLELTYVKPDDFPDLMMDETKIRQVIMNFIDNAIYYTPSGGKIEVELVDKPGSVEFRVHDTGIGVPKNEQPHLFTKFYRAGNARQARPDGTGLGLFMAKKVVLAQGGAVIFYSQEGKGSTFGFIFSKDKLGTPKRPVE